MEKWGSLTSRFFGNDSIEAVKYRFPLNLLNFSGVRERSWTEKVCSQRAHYPDWNRRHGAAVEWWERERERECGEISRLLFFFFFFDRISHVLKGKQTIYNSYLSIFVRIGPVNSVVRKHFRTHSHKVYSNVSIHRYNPATDCHGKTAIEIKSNHCSSLTRPRLAVHGLPNTRAPYAVRCRQSVTRFPGRFSVKLSPLYVPGVTIISVPGFFTSRCVFCCWSCLFLETLHRSPVHASVNLGCFTSVEIVSRAVNCGQKLSSIKPILRCRSQFQIALPNFNKLPSAPLYRGSE